MDRALSLLKLIGFCQFIAKPVAIGCGLARVSFFLVIFFQETLFFQGLNQLL
jgi:hypothetical protein